MRFRVPRYNLNGILLLLAVCSSAYAGRPTGGTIRGTVRESESGKPIPFASVMVRGTSLGASSDSAGAFLIRAVPPSTYAIEGSALGHIRSVIRDVKVDAGESLDLVITLGQSLISLEQYGVVSFSSPLPGTLDQTPSTYDLPSEEFHALGHGLNDPLRSLSIMPGVAQTRIDRNDLSVRGGSPGENLIVIDNIEFPTISHFSMQGSSSGASSVIDLDLIESASLSAGGFGAAYGDRLSSVVDLRLCEPGNNHFSLRPNISAIQFGLNGEAPFPGSGGVLFSVRRSYLDLVYRAYGFAFVPEFWDGLLKASIPLSGEDKLTILVVGAVDDFRFLNGTSKNRYENSRMMFTDEQRITAAATWRHAFGIGYFTISGVFGQTAHNYEQDDTDLAPLFTSRSKEWESTVKGDAAIDVTQNLELSFGVSARMFHFNSSINSLLGQSMYGEKFLRVSALLDTTALNVAAYLQLTQTAGPLTFTAGFRGDRYGLFGNSLVLAPRLSVALKVFSSLTLKTSAGRYYQTPYPLWFTATPFNRGLDPIQANHFILGGEYSLRNDFIIGAEVYAKQYFAYPASLNRPYLVMSNTGSGLGGSLEGYASFGIDSLVSKGTGRSSGIQLFIQKRMTDSSWYGILSVTHNATEFTGVDGNSRRSSFDQPWIVGIAGGGFLSSSWQIGARFRYFAGRPYTPFGSRIEGAYNSARTGSNHSLDIYLSRHWTFVRWGLSAYVNLINAYNRLPVDAPIHNQLTNRVEQIPALGIVPTAGISAEF